MPKPLSLPRRGWWCSTCDQVSFDRKLADRDMAHAHGWGVNGISRCPGTWTPVVLSRPAAPNERHQP